MGKRLIIQILLFCLIALSLGAKSWRIEIRPFFEKAKDYEGLVSYIEKRFKRIPPVDQGLALIVISFAFSELNDSVSEAIHIQRYFKNYETPGADFEFLGSRNAMLLHEYILAWNRRYPGIRNVSISKEDRVFPYFAEKNRIALILDSRAPCVLEISGMDRELFSGYLKRGRNRIELNHVEDMKRRKKTDLQFMLKTGAIRIRDHYQLLSSYTITANGNNIHFNPVAGTVTIVGKKPKPTYLIEKYTKTKRYFDKSLFKKQAIPYLAIGVGIALINGLVVNRAVERSDDNHGFRSFLYAYEKSSTILSVGLTLKGIVGLIRAFKREKTPGLRRLPDEDAKRYNRQLREEIAQARRDIRVRVMIHRIKGSGE